MVPEDPATSAFEPDQKPIPEVTKPDSDADLR